MTGEVLFAIEGRVGRIRLNRPKPIHALNHAMCDAMADRLLAWEGDTAIDAVLIDHGEGRGFCAGGDVRAAAESGARDGKAARAFFYREYQLNHLLFTYRKPVVACMDGITMGGGVGISLPARYRVATERTVFAMPETTIGLFPDVGGGWYLSRLPGRIGQYLALTGARFDGADCRALGLATHYLPSDQLESVKAQIAADPKAIVPGEARIATHRPAIDRLFRSDRYEDILAALDADGGDWAVRERAGLAAKSPQSCKVALRLLREGLARADFAEEMRVEYRLAARICRSADFIEGVRALLVDKDNHPLWNPAAPEAVTDEIVEAIFAPLPADEEWAPARI
jgi:enoyl-CoA hydratase